MKKIYNYSTNLDKETLEQFKNCYSNEFVISAALMPDAHSGYSAPIGSVILTKNKIVPAWVGFDIGCGVIALKLIGKKGLINQIKLNSKKIFNKVKETVPMGLGEKNKQQTIDKKIGEKLSKLIDKYKSKEHDKMILDYIKTASKNHLGTLGSGNHFIELGEYKDEIWLTIHSGSRSLGYKVAEKYMIKASGKERKNEYEKTFPLDTNSELGKEYLNVLSFCLEYALLNRLEIAIRVKKAIEKVMNQKIDMKLWVNKNHNHAIPFKSNYIHRKGATPAEKNERGIIPANMRDGVFLVKGLGNPKFLYSSSHGAGRKLSRKKAKEKISMYEFKESMKGIIGSINRKTLDEAPEAYKDINEVMSAQNKSVKILKQIKPIINWKGQ